MKNNKHMPIVVLIVALISLGCLSLGVAYSFVTRSRVSGTALVITSGNLTSTVEYEAANFMLTSMEDEEGLHQDDYGVITVTKDNVYTVFYTLNIGYAVDSLTSGQSVGNLLPMEYIKVALFSMSGDTVGSTPIVGPVSLSDLIVSEIDSDSNFRNKYLLHFNRFSAGQDSDKYALKVWIDKNTPDTYDESLIYLSVNVDQETLVSKTFYNLSGTIVDSNGAAISDSYRINFNYGSWGSDNTGGTWQINYIPTGTYPISITYGGVEYKSSIHIKTGDSVNLQSTGGATGATNTYIQRSAYTYYATPKMILQANNLTTTTNQLTTTTYTIPQAYVLTGKESLSTISISNIKITLNADGTLGLSM